MRFGSYLLLLALLLAGPPRGVRAEDGDAPPRRSTQDLLRALGASSDPLSALEEQFSGDRAAGLKAFLEEHDVPHEVWSRVGD